MENVFFTLDRVASSLGLWLNRLKSACERHDIKESYKALHFFEKQLIFASTLKLKEVVPEDKPQGRFTPSHKYCSCCGQRRGVAPLNCSTGIDEIVQIECYKQITREPGCCFEMSPQLIAHAGVYRNGGTSSDQYVCTDCLTLGLRILRDQINDLANQASSPVQLSGNSNRNRVLGAESYRTGKHLTTATSAKPGQTGHTPRQCSEKPQN
jgi:hypothetical protein